MALKVVPVGPGPRDIVNRVAEVTFSSSYPAGGEPMTPSDYGLSRILFVAAEVAYSGKLQPVFDPSTSTLRLLATGSAGGSSTEVTTGTNQSAITARVLVAGVV